MSIWALTVAGIEHNEWWRLWTAHVVHYSGQHALLDAAAAVPALILLPPWLRRSILLWLVLVAPMLSIALLNVPGLLEYRGCSGLVAGLWALVGIALVWKGKSEDRTWGALLLALLASKCAAEIIGIVPVWQEDNWQILPLVHWLGAALGLLSGVGLSWRACRYDQRDGVRHGACT